MKIRKSYYTLTALLFILSFAGLCFASYTPHSPDNCFSGYSVAGDCEKTGSYPAWSEINWVYNSSANTCTKTRTAAGQKQTFTWVEWLADGHINDPATQDGGCVFNFAQLCSQVRPDIHTTVVGQTGSLWICDHYYTWETEFITDEYESCTVTDSTVLTSTRPSITKNSLTTNVYVGDVIYDSATGEDTDASPTDVTSYITTSFNTSNYQRVSGQLVYKFTAAGEYTVTYSLADRYGSSATNCGLSAPTRTRTFTVSVPTVTYHWLNGSWGSCVNNVQTRNVWCEPTDGNGVYNSGSPDDVADSYCSAPKPATSLTGCSCQSASYRWDTTAWNPTTCSSGITQTRTVFCEDGNNQSALDVCCAGISKPSSTYVCPVDPCSGLSNVCIGTTSACSTYAQGSCNSTNAPGCSWTTSGSCVGTASACSTYGTSGACTTPSKGCSWSSSTGCTGTLVSAQNNCGDFKRYQCVNRKVSDGYQSDCEYNNCRYGADPCYVGCDWPDGGDSCSNHCTTKALIACTSRSTSTTCGYGNGCTWSTSYSCTGSVSACSTYSQSNCSSVSGCSWSDSSSCTGTATSCSARNQTQCNLSGSGCTWCEGTNTAPVISPATNQSVCLSTVIDDITTATDAEDGVLTSSIVTNSPSGIVKNTQLNYYFTTAGDKVMTYDVTDSGSLAATQKSRTVTVGYCGAWASGTWGTCSGDPATQERTVTCMLGEEAVDDSLCDPETKPATSQSCDSIPVITPQSTVNTYVYTWINDTTTATDTEDGDLTLSIDTGSLDYMVKGDTDLEYYFTQAGTYIITYDVVDSNGNSAVQKTSTVNVGHEAIWDLGDWGNCDENDQRTRTVTCMLSGSPVAEEYCEPPKPNETGACVETDFECTSDNIHWNDCSQTFFLASPRSKICTRQIDPIGATSWNWSIPTDILDNASPRMKVADTGSATTQDTCFDFEGQFVSPEIERVLRLDIGASGEGGAIEKTINIKLINPKIQEA